MSSTNTSEFKFDPELAELKDFGNHRLINKDGSFNIHRVRSSHFAPYQLLVEMGWGTFLLIILGCYIAINLLFAGMFLIAGYENLAGVPQTDSLIDQVANTFFFSVQTFTTVGYGSMAPLGFVTNVIASMDALCGMLAWALATGLVFARFSKPQGQFLFSNIALVAPYNDGWSLQMRVANKRSNRIIDLHATMMMTWLEDDGNSVMRKFARLNLELDDIALFPLNWTIVHNIDQNSPLKNCDRNKLEKMNAEFLIMIDGHDETYAQKVHAATSYQFSEVKWFYQFARMYRPDKHKGTIFDLGKIDEVVSV